jgi:hypothetical protein
MQDSLAVAVPLAGIRQISKFQVPQERLHFFQQNRLCIPDLETSLSSLAGTPTRLPLERDPDARGHAVGFVVGAEQLAIVVGVHGNAFAQ